MGKDTWMATSAICLLMADAQLGMSSFQSNTIPLNNKPRTMKLPCGSSSVIFGISPTGSPWSQLRITIVGIQTRTRGSKAEAAERRRDGRWRRLFGPLWKINWMVIQSDHNQLFKSHNGNAENENPPSKNWSDPQAECYQEFRSLWRKENYYQEI